MDTTRADNVLHWYESLQKQVLDFMTVVPLSRNTGSQSQDPNLNVWSPALADVLVGACNLIESILFDITASKGQESKKTLKDYAELYSSLLYLPERKVFPFQGPYRWWEPFAVWGGWKPGTSFQSPAWWKLHNKSKHSRLADLSGFTLFHTLDALAGALVIIATMPDLCPALVRHEWLYPQNGSPEVLMEEVKRIESGNWVSSSGADIFCVETALFSVPLGTRPLPAEIRDFRFPRYNVSPRIARSHSFLSIPDSGNARKTR